MFELCSCKSLDDEDMALVRSLVLDKEVDINLTNSDDLCPLILLCSSNKSDSLLTCLDHLLLRGSTLDVNAQDKFGLKVLSVVCISYSGSKLLDIIRLLLGSGINLEWDALSETLVNLTLYNHDHPDFVAIFRLFIESGVEEDEINDRLRPLQEKLALAPDGDVNFSKLESIMGLLEEYRIVVHKND